MWLKPNLLGPQKGPASTARLKAQAKHAEVEKREAGEVRIQWMTLMGLQPEGTAYSLEEELEQLSAAIQIQSWNESHS
jgi:hypothetical protein